MERQRCCVCGAPEGSCTDWGKGVIVEAPKGEPVKAPARLWLNEDKTQVVSDGDPRARHLLAGCKGAEIPRALAIKYGLEQAPVIVHLSPDHVLIERGFARAEDSALQTAIDAGAVTDHPTIGDIHEHNETDTPRQKPAHATVNNETAGEMANDKGDPNALSEANGFPAAGAEAGDAPKGPVVEDKSVRGPLAPTRRAPPKITETRKPA